jgi:ketosteroid isomerase-like protein
LRRYQGIAGESTLAEKVVRNLQVAIGMLMASGGPVVASDNTDVMEAVHRWTDAFSSGSFNSDIAPCTEDAVVIDDFPPHVWQAPGACTAWFKAFEVWASKATVTNAAITLGTIRHLDFDAGLAYLVAPVTLSYVKAGKPVNFFGTITMTLRNGTPGWRVSGVAWADQ